MLYNMFHNYMFRPFSLGHLHVVYTDIRPHTHTTSHIIFFLILTEGAYLQRNPKHTSPVADTARIVQDKESHSRL